jgi:hypothetical protein
MSECQQFIQNVKVLRAQTYLRSNSWSTCNVYKVQDAGNEMWDADLVTLIEY